MCLFSPSIASNGISQLVSLSLTHCLFVSNRHVTDSRKAKQHTDVGIVVGCAMRLITKARRQLEWVSETKQTNHYRQRHSGIGNGTWQCHTCYTHTDTHPNQIPYWIGTKPPNQPSQTYRHISTQTHTHAYIYTHIYIIPTNTIC